MPLYLVALTFQCKMLGNGVFDSPSKGHIILNSGLIFYSSKHFRLKAVQRKCQKNYQAEGTTVMVLTLTTQFMAERGLL